MTAAVSAPDVTEPPAGLPAAPAPSAPRSGAPRRPGKSWARVSAATALADAVIFDARRGRHG